jgi:hypothetical protein
MERERVLVRQRPPGTRVPGPVQLDGAGGVRKHFPIAGEDGETAGLLVGERL